MKENNFLLMDEIKQKIGHGFHSFMLSALNYSNTWSCKPKRQGVEDTNQTCGKE